MMQQLGGAPTPPKPVNVNPPHTQWSLLRTAKLLYAVAGNTAITVTLTPESNYEAKSATLTYRVGNDTAIDYAIALDTAAPDTGVRLGTVTLKKGTTSASISAVFTAKSVVPTEPGPIP